MDNPSAARLLKLKSGERYQRLFSKDSGTCGIKSGHVMLKPGENIGLHTTAEREEVIIVIKGRGEARVEKEGAFTIESDSVLYIAPRTDHDIKNTGRGVLEYIFITSPAQDL